MKYDVFISYRREAVAYADLIYMNLINNGIHKSKIFIDKRMIGPEDFSARIEDALKSSVSQIIVVSKDCFVKNDSEKDWFLEEIKIAISLGITIIPVCFDQIASLNNLDVAKTLESNFKENEVNILLNQESVRYDSDFSDASIEKMLSFVEQAQSNLRRNFIQKIFLNLKAAGIILAIISVVGAICFALLFSIGGLIGYYTIPTNPTKIMEKYTTVGLVTVNFNVDGLFASYNLQNDSIYVNYTPYDPIDLKQISLKELLKEAFMSVSLTSSLKAANKSFKYIQRVSRIGGGNKAKNMVVLGIYVGVAVGSILGVHQGICFGKRCRLPELYRVMTPIISSKEIWQPYLSKGYINNINPPVLEDTLTEDQEDSLWMAERLKNPAIILASPVDTTCSAYKHGITTQVILFRYAGWDVLHECEVGFLQNYLKDDVNYSYSDDIVYGYWVHAKNLIEEPEFIMSEMTYPDQFLGLNISVIAVPRKEYDNLRSRFESWLYSIK